jgi:ribonuclease G
MYDEDDAVAKVDGYIISIAGAAAHVGENRMIRIDQVGRTAASALLLDEDGEVVAAPARTARRSQRSQKEPRPSGEGRSGGRGRRRSASADREDSEARAEAGLAETSAAVEAEPEQPGTDTGEPDDGGQAGEDGLQSKPRRRGRRGGRRRSAAKAKAAE